MTTAHQCEDCDEAATLSLASAGMNRSGQPPATTTVHRYCRPCAERHGVPKREPRRLRSEPKQRDWTGLQGFYEALERVPIDEPSQRAASREAALQFREFLHRVGEREAVPEKLRAVIERIVQRTA